MKMTKLQILIKSFISAIIAWSVFILIKSHDLALANSAAFITIIICVEIFKYKHRHNNTKQENK